MLLAVLCTALHSAQAFHPVVSVGSVPELSRAVKIVADLSQKSDFSGAAAALELLPKGDARVQWDDSAVPESSRFDYAKQRDVVMEEWQKASPLFHFSLVKGGGNIRVVFGANASTSKNQDLSGMSLDWSEDPTKPRLTIKLDIQQKGGPVDPALLHNELSFGLGTYFGIAKLPIEGSIMAGTAATSSPIAPLRMEVGIANDNMNVCNKIRDSIARSVPVAFDPPALECDLPKIDLGLVVQGKLVPFKVPVKNAGSGTLVCRLVPDCSCFAVAGPRGIAAGSTYEAPAQMSTKEFSGIIEGGVLRHEMYLLTNDPANPVKTIPVEIKVTPRYRMQPNRQVLVADGNGTVSCVAYLFFPADHPLEVTSAESLGLPGEVTFEKWEGMMADPELSEGPLPRKGYKFTLKVKNIPEGSQFGTNIAVTTDDADFAQILYPVWMQKGIVTQPASLFMGEVGAARRTMSFVLSRPGKDFKITGLRSDSKHIVATAEQTTPGTYRISVVYDGQGASGDYRATVIVTTDDPIQKEIDVPIAGTVR